MSRTQLSPGLPQTLLFLLSRDLPLMYSALKFASQNSECFLQLTRKFCLRYVFCGIYTLEMILKILSRGFIFHTYAYLRDAWNWLDFIVVVLG